MVRSLELVSNMMYFLVFYDLCQFLFYLIYLVCLCLIWLVLPLPPLHSLFYLFFTSFLPPCSYFPSVFGIFSLPFHSTFLRSSSEALLSKPLMEVWESCVFGGNFP